MSDITTDFGSAVSVEDGVELESGTTEAFVFHVTAQALSGIEGDRVVVVIAVSDVFSDN